jgi:hypothetical protein
MAPAFKPHRQKWPSGIEGGKIKSKGWHLSRTDIRGWIVVHQGIDSLNLRKVRGSPADRADD